MSFQYPVMMRAQRYFKAKKFFVKSSDNYSHWTIFAIEHGSFRYRIDNIPGTASDRDVIVCPPGVDFERELLTPLTFHYIHCQSQLAPEAEMALIKSVRKIQFKLHVLDETRITNNLRQLFQFNRRDDTLGRTWKNHLINDVWLLLCIEIQSRQQDKQAVSDSIMNDAKSFLQAHAGHKLLMKQVATQYNLHPDQFTRRFQAAYGVKPYEYLTAIRIEKAKSMLIHTDDTIDHIARSCGYDNGFYFSRIFTKQTHITPSHYRKMYSIPSP